MSTRPIRHVLLLLVLLFSLPALAEMTASLEGVQFFAPDHGFGVIPSRYRISATLVFSETVSGQITSASINDEVIYRTVDRSPDPRIDTMTPGRAHLPGEKLDKPTTTALVQLYEGWVEGQRYTLALTVQTADGQTLTARSAPATAPPGGAIRGFPNVLAITVTETAGLARTNWPVTVGVPITSEPIADPASYFYLVSSDPERRNPPVPFQLFDVVSPEYGPEIAATFEGKPAPTRVSRIYEIGFPADLPAHGSASFLLFYGNTTAAVTPVQPYVPLRYLGQGPGLRIDTGDVLFELNSKTGSLLSYRPKFSATQREYFFKQDARRDVHYNPDVWAPPLGWGHTSDWDLAKPGPYTPTFQAVQGPYAYRSYREGIMPRSNETKTSMTYSFFAGMPFFYNASKMEFTLNTQVNAIRSSEYVFTRGQMTHAVWSAPDGTLKEAPVIDPANPMRVLDHVADLPPDTPFLGLFNEQDGVGLALVTQKYYVSAHALADDAMNLRSEFYISDPGLHLPASPDFAFTYFVRPEIYYQGAVVPKGTIVAERNATVIFRVGKGAHRFDDLLYWVARLRTPPKVDIATLRLPPK